ncbi:MAG: transglutaminase, partial [Myxococcota bacterium]
TYIQRDGMVDDFGVFDHPDELYRTHGTNLSGIRRVLYAYVLRHAMNATVRRLRLSPPRPQAGKRGQET